MLASGQKSKAKPCLRRIKMPQMMYWDFSFGGSIIQATFFKLKKDPDLHFHMLPVFRTSLEIHLMLILPQFWCTKPFLSKYAALEGNQ